MTLDLQHPIRFSSLRRRAPGEHVRVIGRLEPHEWEYVAYLVHEDPDLHLRVNGSLGSPIPNLEFLEEVPDLRRLTLSGMAQVSSLEMLDSLKHLEVLQLLKMPPAISLRPVVRIGRLQRLMIDGRLRNPEVLSDLVSVASVSLSSIRVQSVDSLPPNLEALALYGNVVGQWSPSDRLRGIVALSIDGAFLGTHAYFLAGLSRLEHLSIERMPQLAEVPTADLASLVRLRLARLPGITSLRFLADLPALEVLELADMAHLELHDLLNIAELRLSAAFMGVGSNQARVNKALRLPLPDVAPHPAYRLP